MNTQGYQASQPDKEDIEDILEGPSDLRDRPHNLKEDAEQKLEQAAEKIHEVIEKIEHAGHKLQEKIENYAGFDHQKEAPKKAESGEQEETKGPQEGKKETVPNLAKNWVDKVLGAENPSLEPKVKEISQKISKKIDDFKENLHGQKEDVISNPQGKHGLETQEKHEHHIRTDFKNAFKVKGDTNIADQLSHGLQNMTNTLSNVFKTNKGSTNLKGRQGEPNDTEEQVPLVKQKPSMRKQSDAIASYNLTFKEKMQGGLHSLSSMLTQGVQIAKRKLSAANEPHYVRRKSITLEEERYSRTYRVGEEFREVIAGFSKTVDEDWQDERIDELSKAGVSENPFEPFGTKDIKIPQGEEIHHEGWHNREDFGSFLSGEELVFKAQGVSSSRGESWGKGLAQRSRKDIEKLDRQLDQVISGKEDLGSTKRMGNENIESSAPKSQGDRGLSRKAEKDLEKIERKLDQAISSVPGTEMGLEETRLAEDSGRERQVRSKRVNQGSGSGLVGKSEQDVERLDRQLDQVISGREGEDVEEGEQEYQGFKDITNEVSGRKANKGDEGKLISKVNEGVDYNDKLLDKVIKEGGRGGLASEDKENLGGKKQLKAGNEKIRSHQAENITSASQNV